MTASLTFISIISVTFQAVNSQDIFSGSNFLGENLSLVILSPQQPLLHVLSTEFNLISL